MNGPTYRPGTTLRYATPLAGEEGLTFTLVEDNGDRVAMRSRDFPDARIHPIEVVAKAEVVAMDCPDCGTAHTAIHECEPVGEDR